MYVQYFTPSWQNQELLMNLRFLSAKVDKAVSRGITLRYMYTQYNILNIEDDD